MKPILIVDDEVAIAQLIAMTLARMDCTCQMAFDGLKAAELLEKNEYDLVLLDNKYIALYRDTLYERVWGGGMPSWTPARWTSTFIGCAKKLGWQQMIRTIPRVGYRLEETS